MGTLNLTTPLPYYALVFNDCLKKIELIVVGETHSIEKALRRNNENKRKSRDNHNRTTNHYQTLPSATRNSLSSEQTVPSVAP